MIFNFSVLCQINENARYMIVGGKPGKRATQTFDKTDEPIGSIDDGLKDKYITNPLGFYSTHTSAPWMIFGKNVQYFDRTSNNWEQRETLDHSRKLGAICKCLEINSRNGLIQDRDLNKAFLHF